MNGSTTARRRFLVAAMTLTGVAGVIRPNRSWAQAVDSLDAGSLRTLALVARRLYPHDTISDAVYTGVIDGALAQAAGDESLASAFDTIEAALSRASADFVDLDEAAQVRALRAIEGMPEFAVVQNAVLVGVYNHPAVWNLVGYGGPSWQQGGYLNRGAGEIGWLPEDD
jgi:hypothetical protein